MGPTLVIQVDRKGELDVRGRATAFDLRRASSQRILVAFDLSPSGCLQPHLQPSPREQSIGVG